MRSMLGRGALATLAGVLILGAIAFAGRWPQPGLAETAASPEMVVGIDVDPTGNSATSLGTIDKCISVNSGATFQIDIFLDSVPAGQNVGGFGGFLNFDNTKLHFAGEFDHNFLLMSAPGSTFLLNQAQDQGTRISLTSADNGGAATAEGPGSRGVLGRYTFQAVGSGAAVLTLSGTGADGSFKITDAAGYEVPKDQVWDGNFIPRYGVIAIGMACADVTPPSPAGSPAAVTATATPALTTTLTPAATPISTATAPATLTATPTVPPPTEDGGTDLDSLLWIIPLTVVGLLVLLVGGASLARRAMRRSR